MIDTSSTHHRHSMIVFHIMTHWDRHFNLSGVLMAHYYWRTSRLLYSWRKNCVASAVWDPAMQTSAQAVCLTFGSRSAQRERLRCRFKLGISVWLTFGSSADSIWTMSWFNSTVVTSPSADASVFAPRFPARALSPPSTSTPSPGREPPQRADASRGSVALVASRIIRMSPSLRSQFRTSMASFTEANARAADHHTRRTQIQTSPFRCNSREEKCDFRLCFIPAFRQGGRPVSRKLVLPKISPLVSLTRTCKARKKKKKKKQERKKRGRLGSHVRPDRASCETARLGPKSGEEC